MNNDDNLNENIRRNCLFLVFAWIGGVCLFGVGGFALYAFIKIFGLNGAFLLALVIAALAYSNPARRRA